MIISFQFFLAPPEGCPLPRWYFNQFSEVYDAFCLAVRQLPANVLLLPLYSCDQFSFELDGRHFKAAYGKDYVDHLLSSAESQMRMISADVDERMARGEDRMTLVESRVELLQQDDVRAEQRINVVVARAAEDADAVWNDK